MGVAPEPFEASLTHPALDQLIPSVPIKRQKTITPALFQEKAQGLTIFDSYGPMTDVQIKGNAHWCQRHSKEFWFSPVGVLSELARAGFACEVADAWRKMRQ